MTINQMWIVVFIIASGVQILVLMRVFKILYTLITRQTNLVYNQDLLCKRINKLEINQSEIINRIIPQDQKHKAHVCGEVWK